MVYFLNPSCYNPIMKVNEGKCRLKFILHSLCIVIMKECRLFLYRSLIIKNITINNKQQQEKQFSLLSTFSLILGGCLPWKKPSYLHFQQAEMMKVNFYPSLSYIQPSFDLHISPKSACWCKQGILGGC